MLRSALLIFSGNAFVSIILLVRNLLVARLLSVEDYGVAATFALAMAIVEMASDFGLRQQIVQSKDGDDPRFQNALQGFQILRGVVSAGLMFILAPLLADFLGIPQVKWAYQVLAAVPFLNALVHFDIHRLNRHMRFGPMVLSQALPAVLSVVVVWPLVWLFGDWQVMLWSILIQAMFTVVTSHFLAERQFRPVLDRKIMSSSLRFGWPLLANAVLLFLVFQADKLIVGRALGIEALALFSMGVTLTLTPTLVAAKSLQSLFLPVLSKANDQHFRALSHILLQINPLVVIYFVAISALVGPWFVSIVLGAKYDGLATVFGWYVVGQGLRLLKAGPGVIALAMGNAANAMYANLARVLSIPLSWYLVQEGHGVEAILVAIACGEALGVMVAFVLIRKHAGSGQILIWLSLGAVMASVVMRQLYVGIGVAIVASLFLRRLPDHIRMLKRGVK